MSARRSLLSVVTLVAVTALAGTGAAAEPQSNAPPSPTPRELLRNTQQMMDAVAPGQKPVWDHFLATDCLYTDENGVTMNKAKFLQQLTPLPPGYSGTIMVENPRFIVAGETVVLSYDMNEHEKIFDQSIATRYHSTDTWARRDGQWQMISSQVTRLYNDPPAGTVKAAALKDYAGVYQLAPGVQFVVTLEGVKLSGQRNGRGKVDLLPETPDVFFVTGSPARRIFARDSDGRVISLIDRQNGRDVVWQKIN